METRKPGKRSRRQVCIFLAPRWKSRAPGNSSLRLPDEPLERSGTGERSQDEALLPPSLPCSVPCSPLGTRGPPRPSEERLRGASGSSSWAPRTGAEESSAGTSSRGRGGSGPLPLLSRRRLTSVRFPSRGGAGRPGAGQRGSLTSWGLQLPQSLRVSEAKNGGFSFFFPFAL